ncbi:MAG: protein phosphatase 2C domain-containing protein [Rothia sp. (in: high G+C Gram-positive bacteria)]|nr:protein phosphatase 2C domain-containing protein [Rothia sp. (in: high G+C Gram-positive bacteria)]
MSVAFRFAARSDVGRVRSKNDDSAYAGHYLAVVADGMGGHVGGNVASATTVLDLAPLDRSGYEGNAGVYLADEIVNANIIMNELVGLNPRLAGMGTTCTALLLDGKTIELAHIGDSRAYRLRGEVFEQITTDHTFVQRLLEEGRISPQEAESHPHKNVIMRVLGDVDASPELELLTLDTELGERWLLSSDGLDAVVQVQEIEALVRSTPDLEALVDQLLALTLERGAPDNVTVLALEVVDSASLAADITAPQPQLKVRRYAEDGSLLDQDSADPQEQARRAPWQRRMPQHAKVHNALRLGKWRGESFTDGVLNAMTVRAGVDQAPTPSETDPSPTPAAILRQELAERPHQLVGAAANATQTGMIPTVTARSARSLSSLSQQQENLEPAELPEEYQQALSHQLEPSAPRWPLRLFVAALTFILVFATALSFVLWTKSQFFVGVQDDRVAVFNGINQNLGPFSLHTVVEETDIPVASLPDFSQTLVENSIQATSRQEAEQIVSNLRAQLAEPEVSTPAASPSASSSASALP